MRAVKLIVCIAVSSVLLFLVLTMGVKPLFRSSANESTVGPKFVDPREHSLCQKFFTETCALPGWTPGEPYTKQDFFREVRKTGEWVNMDGYKAGYYVAACLRAYELMSQAVAHRWGSWTTVEDNGTISKSICTGLHYALELVLKPK